MTGAYSARVATEIKGNMTHLRKVTINPSGLASFELPTDSLTVTLAEDWSPHIQAKITTSVPGLLAQLDALDARLNCRVNIQAGYRYSDGTKDLLDLADLGLRDREVSRPDNDVTLNASSDEARAQDRRRVEYAGPFAFTGINAAVQWFADYAVYPALATLDSPFASSVGSTSVAGMDVKIGTDMWSPIEDVAARAGLWVYCTTDRKWRISNRPELGGTPRHALEVGRNGTIFSSTSRIERKEWANESIVEYAWTDAAGASQVIYGRARVTSGPYSVNVVGYKTDHKRYERPATQAQADAAASTRVKSLVTRGRGLELEAHAAYWLRPGDTITVQLLTGAAEAHIIKSITFDLVAGRMSIQTRQPLNVTITTGE